MNKIYWVGPRESDIAGIESLFSGSITIYGSNVGNNISYCKTNIDRINHNKCDNNCDCFFKTELEKIIMEDKTVEFLFYNPLLAYEYGKKILSHSICCNDYELLEQLHDKTRCRILIQNIVRTVPFVTLSGRECTYNNIKNHFISSKEFVVQDAFSSGGDGTIHITRPEQLKYIEPNSLYLVSPYFNDSLSINTHMIICNKNIIFLSPSIQLVNEINSQILYFGADFICYKTLSSEIQLELKEMSIKIGQRLQTMGYRGTVGIDFLLKDSDLYFVEINPRFQASSQLVNKGMLSTYHISLQELHMLSFKEQSIKDINEFDVPFCNYVYTTNNIQPDRLKKIANSSEIYNMQKDGFDITDVWPNQSNVYLLRCIFNTNISSICHGRLILHPNIYTENINQYMDSDSEMYKPYLKIALLNHGVNFTPNAIKCTSSQGILREAVFDAIDIKLFHALYVNVPFNCKFCTFSPFTIDVNNGKLVLSFNNKLISNIEVSFLPQQLINQRTRSGVPYENIINLANDRIRINPAPVCIYKQLNRACKFCNLPEKNSAYEINDIKEVIDYCLENITFRHFLIGGGTYSVQGGWHLIIEIAAYIRSKCKKDIYLMSIPPQDINILTDLYQAGVTEVAFNMEIFDRLKAEQVMPGKGKISAEQYFSAFEEAVKIWGNTGNVRSLLIYGFDSLSTFLQGIETLCEKGVEPIISVFRPLKGTPLENLNPPSTVDLFSLYQVCVDITQKYSLVLGPDCIECQNNTLSYTKT